MKFLKLSEKKAHDSKFKIKVGAIIVKGGRILSTGINQTRYSKLTKRKWTSVHAEEKAIGFLLNQPDGLKNLAGSTLYVTRIKKDGSTGLAKPCKHCQELIDLVKIKRVIWST